MQLDMLRRCLPFALLLGSAAAQEGLIETLNSVPELTELVSYLDLYPELTLWLQELSYITFLAPNNDAFAALADSTTVPSLPVDAGNAETLISYHVLNGIFYSFTANEYTQVPTLALAHADANESLVVGGQMVIARGSAWSSAVTFTSGELQMSESDGNVLNFTGGSIFVIDSFLTMPQTFETSTEQDQMLGGPAFAEALINVPNTQEQVTIDDLSDVTVFLPMNYSLQEVGNVIENMTKAEFDRVVSYHVINEVLDIDPDSPPSGEYETYEGTGVTIYSKNGFVFVNNARVVGSPDWLFRGGMIYMIYGVLNPDNTTIDQNINDAEIAYAGATYTPDFTFPTAESAPTSTPVPSHSHGLSTSAKAGIGAAAAVVLAILIGACMFITQQRRTRRDLGASDRKFQSPLESAYPMKDLEASISHEELVANAAKPARVPLKDFTPTVSVYSLSPSVKETAI